ncbi:hypothetical protein ACPZ19_43690 [Amycolatopsis lurida]
MTAAEVVRCGGLRDRYLGTYKGNLRLTETAPEQVMKMFTASSGLVDISGESGSSGDDNKGPEFVVTEFDVTAEFYVDQRGDYWVKTTVTPRPLKSGDASCTGKSGYSIDLSGSDDTPGKITLNLALEPSLTMGNKVLDPTEVGLEKHQSSQYSGHTEQLKYKVTLVANSCGPNGVPSKLITEDAGNDALSIPHVHLELSRQ